MVIEIYIQMLTGWHYIKKCILGNGDIMAYIYIYTAHQTSSDIALHACVVIEITSFLIMIMKAKHFLSGITMLSYYYNMIT